MGIEGLWVEGRGSRRTGGGREDDEATEGGGVDEVGIEEVKGDEG